MKAQPFKSRLSRKVHPFSPPLNHYTMKDLKQRTIRGGIARLAAQAANFVIRAGSLMILARLLGPKEFGLVGMVTAFTGVLNLLRDFGLSSAAVQRATVTDEQISTLFWLNLLVGTVLGLLTAAMAPFLAAFYHEPRLIAVTFALAAGFVFNAAGVQHSALLQRQMRFTTMALIQVISLILGTAVGIAGAEAGYGYWALVALTVSVPLIGTIGAWLTAGWLPGPPRKGAGIGAMMRFGGTVSLNSLVAYLAYNTDKVLIGRFWGTSVLGIYGRAYQLVSIPTDLAMTIPLTIACVVFADDVVSVLLGPKWMDAVIIFRLLAPTILIFAIINPMGWLLLSLGLVRRSLNIALVFAPTLVAGYLLGLPYGPKGVAFAYSAVMALWVIPFIAWCVKGTAVAFGDVFLALIRPLGFGLLAGLLGFAAQTALRPFVAPVPRLLLETAVLLGAFFGLLFFVGGQKTFYIDLIRGLKRPNKEKNLASA